MLKTTVLDSAVLKPVLRNALALGLFLVAVVVAERLSYLFPRGSLLHEGASPLAACVAGIVAAYFLKARIMLFVTVGLSAFVLVVTMVHMFRTA